MFKVEQGMAFSLWLLASFMLLPLCHASAQGLSAGGKLGSSQLLKGKISESGKIGKKMGVARVSSGIGQAGQLREKIEEALTGRVDTPKVEELEEDIGRRTEDQAIREKKRNSVIIHQ